MWWNVVWSIIAAGTIRTDEELHEWNFYSHNNGYFWWSDSGKFLHVFKFWCFCLSVLYIFMAFGNDLICVHLAYWN
jgi:hypothetical protein